jgi:hypothetical protein
MARDGKPLPTIECADCHVEKPTTEFYRRGNGNILQPCKKCIRLRNKKRREEVYDDSGERQIQVLINNWSR